MNIVIPPIVAVFIILVIGNCMLGLGKSSLMNKCYILLSSYFSAVGAAGMIIIPMRFFKRFHRNASVRDFDSDFVSWSIGKFNTFTIVFIVLISAITLFLLLCLILRKDKSNFVWNNTTVIVVGLMVLNFIAGLLYSFLTINKLFDIAGYILELSVAGFFVLHLPLIAKRILIYARRW